MTHVRTSDHGDIVVESRRYRLEISATGMFATLASRDGRRWLALRPLSALDTTEGPDETLSVSVPRVVADAPATVEVVRRSTRWERALTQLVCTDETVEVVTVVEGQGVLTDAHLLAARSVIAGAPMGFLPSGSHLRTLFSPNPGDPAQLVRSAAEQAVIGATGDGQPGRGHWFFTPAPLSLWLTASDVQEPIAVAEGWVGLSVAAALEELEFVQLAYVPFDRGFALRLEYEAHTRADGTFRAPTILITPGVSDPYAGLRVYREQLAERGFAAPPIVRDVPEWWREPIFCGWGAQSSLARTIGAHAPAHSTQANYDRFLGHLEAHGVVPGTIVIDDKWQLAYGTNEPDARKWPDLRGWIASRHARGQRVLLWWKAWDPEGLPPELCVRNGDGAAVAFDPTNPDACALLQRVIARLVSADGLDCDGLKVDFTSRTPSGAALTVHGRGWGIALLHRLLALVYGAVKETKPDALVVTHTPHPSFVDVTDAIRLNDLLRLEDVGPAPRVVPQMRYRADVVRVVCPELLIDTDDWCAPTLDQWREYVDVKPLLGIPSLYYADTLDSTGETLRADDYRALRESWDSWRALNTRRTQSTV
jgi:hypothetical protein